MIYKDTAVNDGPHHVVRMSGSTGKKNETKEAKRSRVKERLCKATKKAKWLVPEQINPRSSGVRARSDIFFGLSKEKMDAFRDLFGDEGIDRNSFVSGTVVVLNDKALRGPEHLYDIQQLYDEMDLDGSGQIRWDQFSSFLSQIASMERKNVAQDDELKELRYLPKTSIMTEDLLSQLKEIKDSQYIPSLEVILFLQENTRELALCHLQQPHCNTQATSRKCKIQRMEVPSKSRNETCDEIVALAYVNRHRQMAVARADNSISFWDFRPDDIAAPLQAPESINDWCVDPVTGRVERKQHLTVRGLCYSEQSDTLFAYGPNSGAIEMWLFETKQVVLVPGLHSSSGITAALSFGSKQLATGGMDGAVIVSDLKHLVPGSKHNNHAKAETSTIPPTLDATHSMGRGVHRHGVHSLAYEPEHGLLVSASYENVALCWDPNISGYVSLQMRLVGHLAPLAQVCGPISLKLRGGETLHTVATLDSEGAMRLWCLDAAQCGYDECGQRAKCLFTFSANTNCGSKARPFQLLTAWGLGPHQDTSLVAVTKYQSFFFEPHYSGHCATTTNEQILTAGGDESCDTDQSTTKPRALACNDLFSSRVRVAVVASAWTAQFLVIESRRAALVDAVNMAESQATKRGQTAPPHHELNLDITDEVEITAAVCCPRMRKLFVGTSLGKVAAFSIAVGKQVATFESHTDRITHLNFFSEHYPSECKAKNNIDDRTSDDILISVSADATIYIHDGRLATTNDDKLLACNNHRQRLRALHDAHEQPIVAATSSRALSLLATASQDSSVRVWDVCTLSLLSLFSIETLQAEPLALCFLGCYPALAVAESNNVISVLAVWPASLPSSTLNERVSTEKTGEIAFKLVCEESLYSNDELESPSHSLTSLAFYENILYAADESGLVRSWSVAEALGNAGLDTKLDVPKWRGAAYKPREVINLACPADTLRGQRGSELREKLKDHISIFHAVEKELTSSGWAGMLSGAADELARRNSGTSVHSQRHLSWQGLRGALILLAPVSERVRTSIDLSAVNHSFVDRSSFASVAGARRRILSLDSVESSEFQDIEEIEPMCSRRLCDDAIVALNLAYFSGCSFLVSLSKRRSIRLWDSQLNPVACLFGADKIVRSGVPEQYKLLRRVRRDLDHPFAQVSEAIVADEPWNKRKPFAASTSKSKVVHHKLNTRRRRLLDPKQRLRTACIHKVLQDSAGPFFSTDENTAKECSSRSNEREEEEEEEEEEDTPEYKNMAAELEQTPTVRLCYNMTTQCLLNNTVAPKSRLSHQKSELLRRKMCQHDVTAPINVMTKEIFHGRTPRPASAVSALDKCRSAGIKRPSFKQAPAATLLEAAQRRSAETLEKFERLLESEEDSCASSSSSAISSSKSQRQKIRQRPKSAVASTKGRQQCKKSFFVVKNSSKLKGNDALSLFGGPSREMMKSHGRFGPYEVEDVLAARAVFRKVANDSDQLHLDAVNQLAVTSPDPQLRALLAVVAANPNHRSSACTLESFLSAVLPHARVDEIRRAAKMCHIYEMLIRICPDFKKNCTGRSSFQSLSFYVRSEIIALFGTRKKKVETLTLRETRHLINHSKILASGSTLEDGDIEQIGTVYGIDLEQELDAPNFINVLNAVLISEHRRIARRNSRLNISGPFNAPSIDKTLASPAQRRGSKVAIAFAKFGAPGAASTNRAGLAAANRGRIASVYAMQPTNDTPTVATSLTPAVSCNNGVFSACSEAPPQEREQSDGKTTTKTLANGGKSGHDRVRDALLAFGT